MIVMLCCTIVSGIIREAPLPPAVPRLQTALMRMVPYKILNIQHKVHVHRVTEYARLLAHSSTQTPRSGVTEYAG